MSKDTARCLYRGADGLLRMDSVRHYAQKEPLPTRLFRRTYQRWDGAFVYEGWKWIPLRERRAVLGEDTQ